MIIKLTNLNRLTPEQFIQLISSVPLHCTTLDLRRNYLNLRSRAELVEALKQLPVGVDSILIDDNYFGERDHQIEINPAIPVIERQKIIQQFTKQLVRNLAFKSFLHALPLRNIKLIIGNLQISSFNFLSELLIEELSIHVHTDKFVLGSLNLNAFHFSFATTHELREHAISYCHRFKTFSSMCTQYLLSELSADFPGQTQHSTAFYQDFFAGLELNLQPQVLVLSPNFTQSYPEDIVQFFDDRQIVYFKFTEDNRVDQAIQIAKKMHLGQTLILDISCERHLQSATTITSQLQDGVRLVLQLSNDLDVDNLKQFFAQIKYGVVLHLLHGSSFWKTVDVFSKHIGMPIEISCQMDEEEIQAIQERLPFYAAIQFHDLRAMENIMHHCQMMHQAMLQNPACALPDSVCLTHIVNALPKLQNFALAEQLKKPLQIIAAPTLGLEDLLQVMFFSYPRSQVVVKNLSTQHLEQIIPRLQTGQEIFLRNEIAIDDVCTLITSLPEATRVCISKNFYPDEIHKIVCRLPQKTQLCLDPSWSVAQARDIIKSLPHQVELYVRNNQSLSLLEQMASSFKSNQTVIINLQMPQAVIHAILSILGTNVRIGFDGKYVPHLFQAIVNKLLPNSCLSFSAPQLDRWVQSLSPGMRLLLPNHLNQTDMDWLIAMHPDGVNLILPDTLPRDIIAQYHLRLPNRCSVDTEIQQPQSSPRLFFSPRLESSPTNRRSPSFSASP